MPSGAARMMTIAHMWQEGTRQCSQMTLPGPCRQAVVRWKSSGQQSSVKDSPSQTKDADPFDLPVSQVVRVCGRITLRRSLRGVLLEEAVERKRSIEACAIPPPMRKERLSGSVDLYIGLRSLRCHVPISHAIWMTMTASLVRSSPGLPLHVRLGAAETHLGLCTGAIGETRHEREGTPVNCRTDQRYVFLLA